MDKLIYQLQNNNVKTLQALSKTIIITPNFFFIVFKLSINEHKLVNFYKSLIGGVSTHFD